jgi:hypothetical protein
MQPGLWLVFAAVVLLPFGYSFWLHVGRGL